MSTATLPDAVTTRKAGDQLDHLYCCDPNVALCGVDVTDHLEVPLDPDRMCQVCEDLDVTMPYCRAGCPGEVA